MFLEFCKWLSETKWSIDLHESLYMYPWIESTHVLSICFFIGTLIYVDLRLIGVSFQKISIFEMNSKILPWTILGFMMMAISGLLLFYAVPVRSYHNIFFRLKIALILLAGINAFLFHREISLKGEGWDRNSNIPSSVKLKASLSLGIWSLVIISGRMIAYNWFDCDKQPQADWINSVAGCVIDLSQSGEF